MASFDVSVSVIITYAENGWPYPTELGRATKRNILGMFSCCARSQILSPTVDPTEGLLTCCAAVPDVNRKQASGEAMAFDCYDARASLRAEFRIFFFCDIFGHFATDQRSAHHVGAEAAHFGSDEDRSSNRNGHGRRSLSGLPKRSSGSFQATEPG
jgi:hypothetical protein